MSSNFNFYVNRQGVQGKRGAKGEQGFSPVISVESQTANEYILRVENEDGSFTTPNLRGNAIENNGGTYIRFNPDTEQMYTGYADGATTEQAGVVRMGTYDDLVAGESEELVPNVADVHNYVQNSIGSIGGVVTTEQFNTYTSETAITLDNLSNNKLDKSTFDSYTSATNSTLESLSTNKVDTSTFDSYVNSTSSTLNTLETEKLDFTNLSNSLIEGANVTLAKDAESKTITISSSGSAQVQANWAEADSSNPSFIQNKPTLGTMASEDASNYTPSAGLSDVAISGSYNDLLNKPTIPEAQVNADWNATSGVSQILNKPTLFSGDYNDLTNKPDIPAAANNATITITQGGVTKGSFTTNQATDATIDIDAGDSITVDSAIDSNSENPVQNKVIASALDNKQDALVSGTNIKTLNGNSILGSGDLTLDGLPSQTEQSGKFLTTDGTDASWGNLPVATDSTVGLVKPDNNTITVSNGVIEVTQSALTSKQDTLVSGTNIKTINGTSVLGSGDITTGNVSSSTVNNIVQITQADYDALATKDANTQYIITDAPALALADLSNISKEGIDVIKNNSSGRNVGELIPALIPLQDANLHLLDGTLLRYGTYKEFVDYIAALHGDGTNIPNYFCTESEWQASVTQYGVCGKFVYDSTNNTVRLPKVTGKIDGTTDINALGDLEPLFVRLPNITGTVKSATGDSISSSGSGNGALRETHNRAANWSSTSSGGDNWGGAADQTISFDASRSSSVYSGNGSNTAIHEQAIKCFIYIVIATSSKTEIQTNIDEITTDLNGKADTDLSNMSASQSAKNEIVSWGIPDWNNKIAITSVPYTAPCAGIVSLYNASMKEFPGNSISVNGKEQTYFNPGNYGTWNLSGYVIVDKNDVVTCSYFMQESEFNYFVPMKGAN